MFYRIFRLVVFMFSGIIMFLLWSYLIDAYSLGIDFYYLKFNEYGEMAFESVALLFCSIFIIGDGIVKVIKNN